MMHLHGHLHYLSGEHAIRATYRPGHGWTLRIFEYIPGRILHSANSYQTPEEVEAAAEQWLREHAKGKCA